MASGDWQRKVAEWLRGRQGPDDLAVFCVNLAIMVLLVNAFLRTSWLGWTALLLVAGVAVAVNNAMVPRTEWATRTLAEGDDIVILKAFCGG